MTSYSSIQYLRGAAALLVVIFHLEAPLEQMGYGGAWPIGLSAGVDIFFVISGFVMWTSTIGRPATPAQFYRKRLIRIVPLYWLLTSVMVALLLAMPSAFNTSVFSAPHVVASYLFVPMPHPVKPSMEPLLFPGWTLNYEMFFYLIFGLFLLVRPAVRMAGTVAVLTLLVVAGLILRPPVLSLAGFYTSPILLEFAAGLALGALVSRRTAAHLLPAPLALVCVLGGVIVLLTDPVPTNFWLLRFGLAAIAIVAGAIALEGRGWVGQWTLPRILGDASYSIYLTQLISMAAFRFLWFRAGIGGFPGDMILYAMLDVTTAIMGGIVCYHLVEKPLLRLFTRRGGRLAKAVA
ncbi:acyltransferase family protein [Sphingobium olei]|uniref:Acyltransferase family protein n=1 Tax=Sphingobium olei TaxID=420955 RepID=A0ABW3P6D3_9SPHN|nr:acyltransferase [Sphingobium sp.]